MVNENSSDQVLLNLILEELQQTNQQLAIQHNSLQSLKEKITHSIAKEISQQKMEELMNSLRQYHVRLFAAYSPKDQPLLSGTYFFYRDDYNFYWTYAA